MAELEARPSAAELEVPEPSPQAAREEGSRAAGGCAPKPRERGGRPEIPPPGPPRAPPERREGGSLLGSGSAGRGGAGAAGSSCGGARPARRGEDGDADEARTEAR